MDYEIPVVLTDNQTTDKKQLESEIEWKQCLFIRVS